MQPSLERQVCFVAMSGVAVWYGMHALAYALVSQRPEFEASFGESMPFRLVIAGFALTVGALLARWPRRNARAWRDRCRALTFGTIGVTGLVMLVDGGSRLINAWAAPSRSFVTQVWQTPSFHLARMVVAFALIASVALCRFGRRGSR